MPVDPKVRDEFYNQLKARAEREPMQSIKFLMQWHMRLIEEERGDEKKTQVASAHHA